MKFTTQSKPLLKSAALAAQATPTRSTLPVLSCLKLEASSGSITITGASIENRIEHRIPVEIETPGAICVDADKFISALTRSQSETVSVLLKDNALLMEMGSMRCRLSTINPDEFVPSDRSDFKAVAEFPSSLCLKSLADLKWVPEPADSRFFCHSLRLGEYNGKMALMATNGHCALIRFLPGSAPEIQCSIPHGLAALFEDALKSNAGTAIIASNDRSARLTRDDCVVTGQLIAGAYPDLKRVIETMTITSISVIDRMKLIEACENCAIFSDDRFNAVRLSFSADQLIVSVGSNMDSATDLVPITAGPSATIKIRISYLISALKAFDSDTIKMEIGPSHIVIQDDKTIFVCCLISGGGE